MRTYTFEMMEYDEETGESSRVNVSFDTMSDTWSGFDGPMSRFLDFLKGTGFVFHHEAQIGIMDKNGEFIDAADPV